MECHTSTKESELHVSNTERGASTKESELHVSNTDRGASTTERVTSCDQYFNTILISNLLWSTMCAILTIFIFKKRKWIYRARPVFQLNTSDFVDQLLGP